MTISDLTSNHPPLMAIGDEVRDALDRGGAVVALESAVLTHGLPEPYNVQALHAMDDAVRAAGAIPALCIVVDGCLHVGAGHGLAAGAAADPRRQKASVRDLGHALASGATAGLTVAATLFAAGHAGISVFATGGIGGVHRPAALGDISADIGQLAISPVITVCSGAKSILDIPRTLESLETASVPVFGFDTDTFPAFYLRSSGLPVPRLSDVESVVAVVRAQRVMGIPAGPIVANPIPAAAALPPRLWDEWLAAAQREAETAGIRGKELTPYLLDHVAVSSGGRTLEANLALLEANASLAGRIAVALAS
ncbi:MAG TPA: pseudouridine-5'-phosphate glycosidase [Chloroflexota bacterium]|nr:pseudouridine-5'-phosphate glycosidase [Chloroflexota bacterium]